MYRKGIKWTIAALACIAVLWMAWGVANAGQMMDEFYKLSPAGQCQQMAQVYREGIVGRNEGFGREIAGLDDTLLPKFQAGEWKPEKDRMYMFGWDNLDDDVKALFTELAQLGWDHADEVLRVEGERISALPQNREYIGKLNIYLDPGRVFHMTGEFLRECVDRTGSRI